MTRRRYIVLTIVLALAAASCSAITSGDSGGEAGGELQSTGAGLGGGDDTGDVPPTTVADSGDRATADSGDLDAPEEGGDDGADEATAQADLGDGAVTPAIQTVDLGRDIIYTAELDIAASDVAAATEEATRVIQSLGGIVFGQRTTGEPEPRSVLTFKVPPEDFQTALDRLGGIGKLRNQTVSADDVTERIVDLESRINTAQASVERLRDLLAEADSVEVIAQLENQLLERETQLETLRGQLRTLQDQVALATIVLTVTEARVSPGLDLAVTAYPGHDGAGLSCPGEAGLSVTEGDPATVCFELVNSGDTPIGELALEDPNLDVSLDDLIVVQGDPAGVLDPGDAVMLAWEVAPTEDLRTQTTVSGVPLDAEGEPLEDRQVATTTAYFLNAVDPGGVPTFAEGLEESWELLVTLGQVALLAVGWLLPFAWIPLVAWIVFRTLRRRRPEAPAVSQDEEERQPEPV